MNTTTNTTSTAKSPAKSLYPRPLSAPWFDALAKKTAGVEGYCKVGELNGLLEAQAAYDTAKNNLDREKARAAATIVEYGELNCPVFWHTPNTARFTAYVGSRMAVRVDVTRKKTVDNSAIKQAALDAMLELNKLARHTDNVEAREQLEAVADALQAALDAKKVTYSVNHYTVI